MAIFATQCYKLIIVEYGQCAQYQSYCRKDKSVATRAVYVCLPVMTVAVICSRIEEGM